MSRFLLINKAFFWVIFLFPVGAYALDGKSVDMQVEAEIHSSMQMQWQRIDADDQRYRSVKNKIRLKSDMIFLPYGLYVELQSNDISRIISLRVNNLTSTNNVDIIKQGSIYISHNGGRPVSAKKDLAILDIEDRGELKKHTLLFIVKTSSDQKPGQYLANFKFVSNVLP